MISYSARKGTLRGAKYGAICGAAGFPLNWAIGIVVSLFSANKWFTGGWRELGPFVLYLLLYVAMATGAGTVVGAAFGLVLGVTIGVALTNAPAPPHAAGLRAAGLGIAACAATPPVLIVIGQPPVWLAFLVFAPVFGWAAYKHGVDVAEHASAPV